MIFKRNASKESVSSISKSLRKYYKIEKPKDYASRKFNNFKIQFPIYLSSLFPILSWLSKYNFKWFYGDLLSGITIGILLIPQSIAYSKLAEIPIQYGLYSSFISNIVYTLVGGSREISMGPNAVLSLIIANIINKLEDYDSRIVSSNLCLLFSIISTFIGLFKLGFLLELIPSPVLFGFTMGAAFTIVLSQLPNLLGIPLKNSFNNVAVLADLFNNITNMEYINLIIGISSLLSLLTIDFVINKYKKRFRFLSFILMANNTITIVLFTLISLLIKSNYENLKIIGDVPNGFNDISFKVDTELWGELISNIPSLLLVAILEHVAVCKTFSTKIGYRVSISQEFFSVGLCNFFTGLLNGYPISGSLSRAAVLSQSGVKTPLSCLFVSIVILIALYFLTSAFYYIPISTLASIIIKSSISLLPGYKYVIQLFNVSKKDFLLFIAAFLFTFFLGVQYGILISVGLAFMFLVYNIAKPKFYVLGKVCERRDVYVDKYHPAYQTDDVLPGVIIFRIQESIIFANINYLKNRLMDYVLETTEPSAKIDGNYNKLWSNDLNERAKELRKIRALKLNKAVKHVPELPFLKAVILDLSGVNTIDASGIKGLKELKDELNKYCGTNKFELHFVSIHLKVLRTLMISDLALSFDSNNISTSHNDNANDRSQNKLSLLNFESVKNELIDFQADNLNDIEIATSLIEFNQEIEPILLNCSAFIHLTLNNAVKAIKINFY